MEAVGQDPIWKALADPTRRSILEALANHPATTGEIVESFAPRLVRTAVMKHLDVLEEARLIRVERKGRLRWNHLERRGLKQIADWLEQRMLRHKNNLERLKLLAESEESSSS